MKIKYFRRGNIEHATGNMGRPYRWAVGYSETSPNGGTVFPWMTRRECCADAAMRGGTATFPDDPPRRPPTRRTVKKWEPWKA